MKRASWGHGLLGLALLIVGVGAGEDPRKGKEPFEMSKAVVCKRVDGYEKYTELPDASLTNLDKLNVYFRPLNFRVDPAEKPTPGRRFKARFREDCVLRHKGEKTPVQKKEKLLEYDPVFESRDERLYLVNNISLKGLTPGDYELDILLHDILEEGVTASQTVAFTIVPVGEADPKPKAKGTDEPESPPAPARNAKKSKSPKGKP